jgi:4'-phosphopantetheinyl transferase
MGGRLVSGVDSVTVLWCTVSGNEREAAHAVLVRQLACALGVDAGDVALRHSPQGRPLAGGAAEGVCVSLSHTHGALAVAFCRVASVGVDVEAIRSFPVVDLAARWLDPGEREWLAGVPADDRSSAFLWLWTQKEAVGKALGTGLRGGGLGRRMPAARAWPPPARTGRSGLRLDCLPDTPGVASGAVFAGGDRYVIGVAAGGEGPAGFRDGAQGGPGPEAGMRVRVRRLGAYGAG